MGPLGARTPRSLGSRRDHETQRRDASGKRRYCYCACHLLVSNAGNLEESEAAAERGGGGEWKLRTDFGKELSVLYNFRWIRCVMTCILFSKIPKMIHKSLQYRIKFPTCTHVARCFKACVLARSFQKRNKWYKYLCLFCSIPSFYFVRSCVNFYCYLRGFSRHCISFHRLIELLLLLLL